MTSTKFQVRLFLDKYFIYDLLKHPKKVDYFEKITRIHTKSLDYPFLHNHIFDSDFLELSKFKKNISGAILGICHPIQIPLALNGHDEISKVVKYCINLATKKPYKILILTNKEKEPKYENNEHYTEDESVKDAISVVSGDLALEMINLISPI